MSGKKYIYLTRKREIGTIWCVQWSIQRSGKLRKVTAFDMDDRHIQMTSMRWTWMMGCHPQSCGWGGITEQRPPEVLEGRAKCSKEVLQERVAYLNCQGKRRHSPLLDNTVFVFTVWCTKQREGLEMPSITFHDWSWELGVDRYGFTVAVTHHVDIAFFCCCWLYTTI